MKKRIMVALWCIVFSFQLSVAQTYYVDAQKGSDTNAGSLQAPFQTLEKAVAVTNMLTGQGAITIKLLPGLYALDDKVVIHPVRMLTDTMRFTLEAQILPGDSLWSAWNMPVIQSVATNNSLTQFRHSTGLLVASSHVTIRGLKFLGNANPEVVYYYPVTRENPSLTDMEISQCYFIGEKNAVPIQGGVWAQGQGIHINHSIFYGCRNAILLFQNIAGCAITHNIIHGAYESAFWIGENHLDFEFSNNVISHCHFVWVNSHSDAQTYQLKNSVIANNEHFLGKWNQEKYDVVAFGPTAFQEDKIVKTGKVELIERLKPEEHQLYLHLTPASAGYGLRAGL